MHQDFADIQNQDFLVLSSSVTTFYVLRTFIILCSSSACPYVYWRPWPRLSGLRRPGQLPVVVVRSFSPRLQDGLCPRRSFSAAEIPRLQEL
eukprot:2901332-Pyramimonas_sp.AAC.1